MLTRSTAFLQPGFDGVFLDIPRQVGSHWYGGIEGNIRGDWDGCWSGADDSWFRSDQFTLVICCIEGIKTTLLYGDCFISQILRRVKYSQFPIYKAII